MENEYISKLNKYLLEEDMLSVSREVSALKIEFDDWLLHSEGQQQVAVIKAKELGEEIEEIEINRMQLGQVGMRKRASSDYTWRLTKKEL